MSLDVEGSCARGAVTFKAPDIRQCVLIFKLITLLFSVTVFAQSAHAQEPMRDRPEWANYFSELDAQGTVVVADERANARSVSVYDERRAQRRYSPASTFKILHTLFALDAGVVRDEFQVFRWDGVTRSFAAHNQDQDLRSAMRNSAVWVYQGFAKEIGEDRARNYLRKLGYGNADPSTAQGD